MLVTQSTYVTLDIGSSSVRVMVGEVRRDSVNMIGVGEAKSRGIKKGAIVDIDETVNSIKEAVEKAERMINASINHVVVGITGNHIQMQRCHGVVAVSSEDREIGDEDVNRVMDTAQVVSIPPDREIIGLVPKQFILDSRDEIKDPRGMIGVRLEMEGTLITGSKSTILNMLRCVERAGLEIADILLQPLAAGDVALSEDEKALGVALVDLGGGSTTVTVFDQGDLVGTRQIPVGGDHITNDISVGFKTSKEEADLVKLNNGHAYVPTASDEEDDSFEVSKIGSREQQLFTQWQLANIIEPRLAETFELVDKEIKRMGYDELPGGFVLIGGSAKIPGIMELAEEIFDQNVRIAIPDYIGVREPYFTNGIGLMLFAHKHMRIQGKDLSAKLSQPGHQEQQGSKQVKREQVKKETPARNQSGGKGSVKDKVSNMFKSFFE
ncbi:cell division protein FtsA [Salisediminibacterium selenitireducens]|uniref:Cell division protein FtsA n=1 Tax=Bacillus selenitireducens (strain ATCC 700615 / DSM 15326 / MLS10) TaxID=439292 RepID=D6XTN3_BACIE|nr:cell division protein FtsA [Salisediminibacterium selenitireducens]ADH99169.1 cell division protein FtsA [[Bacillus] selenitireducens MLS10]